MIEECLKENPEIDSLEDISLLCDIDEALVSAYFESKPLTKSQEAAIREKYNAGCKVEDIVNILKISDKRVKEYVERTFLTFTSEEGKKALAIILKISGKFDFSKLREMVISRDLKLQDQLCCILRNNDESQFTTVRTYFNKFAESKLFFEVDIQLSIEDILHIKQCRSENVAQLSKELQKVESIISEYLHQYNPNELLNNHLTIQQFNQINTIVTNFGKDKLSFQTYRMIISESFEDIFKNAENNGRTPKEAFLQLLPLSFYYLKCSLPLADITQMIANSSQITVTTHDVFHIIFQLSDPVLKGFCIEHYSFSNPVPLYYPLLLESSFEKKQTKFAICKELWYSMQQFNGLISFGLGWAGWNPVGKSHLLDLIFGTDFEKGNPSNSAFHFNSIDIQMTNNLFGEMKDRSRAESTKWAYIDCNGNSNLDVIKVLCQQLDIALIHVTSSDYSTNRTLFDAQVHNVTSSVTHVYILIRDCKLPEVRVESKCARNLPVKIVSIPDLTKQDIKIHSVKKSLKEIGFEILHLNSENMRSVGSDFLENVLQTLDNHSWKDIQSNKKLIQKITAHISTVVESSSKIDFSFLSYYPLFVDYMSCYHNATNETDQKKIDELNIQCGELDKLLKNASMGDIVLYFNKILQREDSTLILWKLSQQLFEFSKQTVRRITNIKSDSVIEQKNDKYTIEILWREALLTNKYGNLSEKPRNYTETFATNFSKHVERREAFELIDGDNLRFFNKDIDELLSKFYERQSKELSRINKGKKVQLKQAPIVVSIFGPQSSGKSTLLNYCFGCKFLTSAGRCTRGVYGSLSKLSRPVNLTDSFLILDTEGLDAIERGNIQDTSMIHFDRTMVLFCLSVSQVVIINVKGDIGSEMQNLLQICAYSLNRLKVRKVAAPKIFFVLNQQADPDPGKHLDSINILMEKLNRESELMDTEGIKVSELIQVSRDNLFILPSAFNSEQMNKPGSKLFDSKVIKLSPTITFADKCADLRLGIIQQLDSMPVDDRSPFNTMSEWMDMSGTIWDTILKYQDIVKYKNVEELVCSNLLRNLVAELMKKNIYSNQEMFQDNTEKLLAEIDKIDTLSHPNTILTKIMAKFDEDYSKYQDDCLNEFNNRCRDDSRLKKMNHICDEQRRNLSRLIYIERKNHEDKIKYHIRAVLTEIKLSVSMNKFQEAIIKNVDKYLELDVENQKEAFEETWIEYFGAEDRKEEELERDETFEDLYSIFKMESRTMENKSTIYELFRNFSFFMDRIIDSVYSDLISRFKIDPKSIKGTDQFIYPCYANNIPIREMTPFAGSGRYEYLGKDSLFTYDLVRNIRSLYFHSSYEVKIRKWVPKQCHPLVHYFSGYFNHPDITWGSLDKNSQILLLASQLKAPEDFTKSTWDKFVNNILTSVQEFIAKDPTISQGTVKEIINFLYSKYKVVNYEIGYFEAMLSNTAERTISNYVFSIAFKSLLETKTKKRSENRSKTEIKKVNLLRYFLQKIENRKMVRGKWDRSKMSDSDQKISKQFAKDFIGGLQRGVVTGQQANIEEYFKGQSGTLSRDSIMLSADDAITKELATSDAGSEILDVSNFTIQYICNRNELIRDLFHKQWNLLAEELYTMTAGDMKAKFTKQIGILKKVLGTLLENLNDRCSKSGSARNDKKAFDSDSNFEIANIGDSSEISNDFLLKGRESPFKAMLTYLRMYLDPTVSPTDFNIFFADKFLVDGVEIQPCDTYILCEKIIYQPYVLDGAIFKKLSNTKMFNSENIFNIHDYISNFLFVLDEYIYEFTGAEFEDMIKTIRERFEKDVIGCPSQCPSCGKLCERELHQNDGNCQIKTGHQICSMGGRVWNVDEDKTAVLFMCDDYKDSTRVLIPGETINWGEFKEKCGNEWDWNLPTEERYVVKQRSNREKMRNIWNTFGKGILRYYFEKFGTEIKYIPYTSVDEVFKTQFSVKYNICFVIDGTGSMHHEIERARLSVGQFISKYKERGTESEFKVVIYRDHCDSNIIEMFPNNPKFTPQHEAIQNFLKGVEADGGGDYPEAVLDGLATAATKCEWENKLGSRNVIIHIFDAPPHGDFPNYKSHYNQSNKGNCCCCNHGTLCHFDWERDVWSNIIKFGVQYHGINTGRSLPGFEEVMKSKLGELCGEFQTVGKEVVNDAILQIFIDFKTK